MNETFEENLLDRVRVVLVRTFHPGNIGSAARAMKTMGLSQLYLVQPCDYPSHEADKLAAGATDTLAGAVVVESVLDAIGDCSVVAACSARRRDYDLPVQSSRVCAENLRDAARAGPVALMFGPERQGLTNDDLSYATHRVEIDANPEYSSLNMASAVQILSYELRQALLNSSASEGRDVAMSRELPTAQAMAHYFDHVEQTFSATGFVSKKHPGELIKRLQHLYARAEVDKRELNILQGMLSSIDNALARLSKS